ncbi:MAG: PP2C family protein-serine/threonine phosphatase [Lachnospiraceae bacterium]|nr:PP2C family protein-serine/threonine phosphatase [Lachnospiraceae bacterium]MBQ9402630.1 PP2C family protein-serine/threonine phosphatase [Clostridia bacterium]
MTGIHETAAVSCYADTAALLVVVLLLFLSGRYRGRRDASLRIFYRLSLALAGACVTSFICHACTGQTAPWCRMLATVSRTFWILLTFLVVVIWNIYVENKLYGDKKLRSFMTKVAVPVFAVVFVLLATNLFTGIVFTYKADCTSETTWIYTALVLTEVVGFLVPIARTQYYDRIAEKVRFLHVLPMILPVGPAVAAQYFLPVQTDVLGFAGGIVLLYMSMADELRVIDEESGLYNEGMLTYIFELGRTGKSDMRSALVLETEGCLPAAFGILHDTLQQDHDVIRIEENRFLMFSKTAVRSELQLLSTHIEEAVEKHNEEHPDENLGITVHSRMRTDDETPIAFLRSAVEDKDAGDPVRGVVSMISELDRLDKELKLAADIQSSMLPAKFPAFPDRNEFDLFASMQPAKEVGGDFYDFFLIDSDHLGLVIADVSGKGIPAALFMMVSKTLVKNQLMSGADPAAALERVNLQLYERNSSMMFVSVWAAVLEISTGRGLSCNAGHENPGLRREGRGFELLKYRHGMVLGATRDATYENREFELRPGDCVFVYTDGVPEAANTTNVLFGTDRLQKTLNEDAGAAPEELIRRVHAAVSAFADSAPQFDDITMLCVKYNGERDG